MTAMTSERLSEPRERAEAVATTRQGRPAEGRPATTVPVMPLWERLRTGARG